MYKIVSLKVNTVCTLLNEMQFNCFGILKLCCKVKNSVGGGDVAEWFRVLDLKSGGPWFNSSTLLLPGFVLSSPKFNSLNVLCR